MAKRINGDHEIIFTVKMPEQKGCLPCEIVIGKRDTAFEPYVAWHCFGGNSYSWGHYVQTKEDAMEEVIDKAKHELHCSEQNARWYVEKCGVNL